MIQANWSRLDARKKIGGGNVKTALCWGCAPGADIHRLLDIAAVNGFDEVSITPGHYLDAVARGACNSQLEQLCASKGVSVGVIDPLIAPLPGVPNPREVRSDWRHFFEYTVQDAFQAADALDARTVNLAHFLGSPLVSQRGLESAVRDIAQEATRRGKRVSVEFIPGTGIPTLASAIGLIERVGLSSVGVMFDTWHFLRSEGLVSDLAQLGAGQVFELQLSDRRTPLPDETYVPMAGRLPPGDGEAPLVAIVRALCRGAPDLVVGLEVFTAEPGNPEAAVKRLAAATRTFLRDVVAAK